MNYLIDPTLKRLAIKGFAFPLGWNPSDGQRPFEGYTIARLDPDLDLPDTHQFQIAVSHERLKALLSRLMEFLPDSVYPILEIISTDAYRQVDTLMSPEPMPKPEFLATWNEFEPLLLDDCALAAGAMSEDPYVEVFLEANKFIIMNIASEGSTALEAELESQGLHEVPSHWIDDDDCMDEFHSVLLERDDLMTLDEIIVQIQRLWRLELNVDPDGNPDESGRDLGVTLWHIVVLAVRRDQQPPAEGARIDVWLSAASLGQVEELVADVFDQIKEWDIDTVVSQDRVAFDDRPPELNELVQGSSATGVWKVWVEPLESQSR